MLSQRQDGASVVTMMKEELTCTAAELSNNDGDNKADNKHEKTSLQI